MTASNQPPGNETCHWGFGCGYFSVCNYVFSEKNLKGGENGITHCSIDCDYFSDRDYAFNMSIRILCKIPYVTTGYVVALLRNDNV